MNKSLGDKLQRWLALISIVAMVGGGVLYNMNMHTETRTNNLVQGEQIKYLREQLDELKISVKEINVKIDRLIDIRMANI